MKIIVRALPGQEDLWGEATGRSVSTSAAAFDEAAEAGIQHLRVQLNFQYTLKRIDPTQQHLMGAADSEAGILKHWVPVARIDNSAHLPTKPWPKPPFSGLAEKRLSAGFSIKLYIYI